MNATRTHSNAALRRKRILLGAIVAVIILGSVTLGVYLLVSYLWSSTNNGSKRNGQNVNVIGEEPFEEDEWMRQLARHRELLGDGKNEPYGLESSDSCANEQELLDDGRNEPYGSDPCRHEDDDVWIPDAKLHAVRWLEQRDEDGIANTIGVKHSSVLMEYRCIDPKDPPVVYVRVTLVDKSRKHFFDFVLCTNLEDNCNMDKAHEMEQIWRSQEWEAKEPLKTLYETLAKNPEILLWKDHYKNVRSTVPGILPYDVVHSNCHHYAASIWYMATLEREKMPNRDKIRQLIHLPNPVTDRRMEFHCSIFEGMVDGSPLTTIIGNWRHDPEEYLRWYCLKKGWRNDPNEPHRFVVTGDCSWKNGPIVGPLGTQPYG